MNREFFLKEKELREIKEEDDAMNLSSFNRFLQKKFKNRIELVDKDEIIQIFGNENVNENVLKEAVLFCKEKCMENNQIVNRNYRSYHKIVDELDELITCDDDTFKILKKLENGEDIFVWELYAIALNKLMHPRVHRFLISVREMETERG